MDSLVALWFMQEKAVRSILFLLSTENSVVESLNPNSFNSIIRNGSIIILSILSLTTNQPFGLIDIVACLQYKNYTALQSAGVKIQVDINRLIWILGHF